jgi:hypothetical protein
LIKFGRKIVKHAKFENRKENVLKGQKVKSGQEILQKD